MVFREDLSDVQRMVLAVLPVPTAVLSLSGSFAILVLVSGSRLTSYKRILIGLSFSDILLTSTIATGPLFEPRLGTQAICSLTGFLAQTSLLSNSFYSGFLALYFLYTVRIGWSPSRFARLIEPWVHGFIAAFIVATGAISLSLEEVFEKAPTGSTCWIAKEYSSLIWLIMIIISLTFGAIIAANLSIYLHVRFLTKRSLRRSMNPSVATKRKHLVAAQSFCYVAAYALTYTPSFIMGLHLLFGGVLFRSTTTYFVFDAVYLVSMPFTGFLNLIVFLRPRYLQYKEQHPNASNWRYFQLSLSNYFTGAGKRPRIINEPDLIQDSQHLPIEDKNPAGQEPNEHDAENAATFSNPTDHSDDPVCQ